MIRETGVFLRRKIAPDSTGMLRLLTINIILLLEVKIDGLCF
jgi:hypothetical protein